MSAGAGGPDAAGRAPRTLAVRLSPDAERQVRGGHPWVFDGGVRSVKPAGDSSDPRSGDLAVVFDQRRRFVAVGLWDPDSPIRIRVLHHGAPTRIDRAWFAERIELASARRSVLLDDRGTTGIRLVNGENDGLPALVVDRYGDTVVVKLYSGAWFAHLDTVLDVLVEHVAPSRVVLRLARVIQRATPVDPGGRPLGDGATLLGSPPDGPVMFTEHGLRFEAEVVSGQKTGFFLDQRDNRARVRDLSPGARVLDVYSCTGGFSVSAAAGGASSVHSVDISPGAIEATRRNLAHNSERAEVRGCDHRATVGDAAQTMAALAAQGAQFDLVVVDPPSFASKQHQVPGALRAYGRLSDLALDLVRPGGWLLQASCSARVPAPEFFDVVTGTAAAREVRLHDVERSGHAVDHPIGFEHGEYLKALLARVEPR